MKTVLVVLLLASTAHAGNRYCNTGYCAPVYKAAVVQQVAYPPQTIIQNQNVFYSVGQDVRQGPNNAIVQAESQRIQREYQRLTESMREFSQFQEQQPQTIVLKLEAATVQQQQVTTEHCQVEQTEQTRFNQTAFPQACMKCHTGANAKGDFHLDALTCKDKLRAIEQIVAGTMPPSGPLQGEEKTAAVNAILALPSVDDQPQQPAPPLPPQDNPPETAAPTDFSNKIDPKLLMDVMRLTQIKGK